MAETETTPYYSDELVTLHHGDCIDVMRGLPDCSVDAVVTDPPYALNFMGKAWDDFRGSPVGACVECGNDDPTEGYTVCLDCLAAADEGQQSQNWKDKATHSRGYADNNNAAFQQWCELWATEALRLLKPGGHLLAFGGTRTFHRLACAIEDAGFEIRDSIAWMYGSGFPKSLDVSKADRTGSWIKDKWEGWGTALKPAFEPIVVARKPLTGTVAANVLAHGTGIGIEREETYLPLILQRITKPIATVLI